MKVTIIVPVYNAEQYIEKCVNSIKRQTYEAFELLLVNDGSTDHSGEIGEGFAKEDSRIRVIHQKNQGPDYARKTGMEHSTGEYLMFVDGDDYIGPTMLEVLVNASESTGADLVCSQIIRVDESGKEWNDAKMTEQQLTCYSVEENLYHFFVTRYISSSYSTKLIKKELLEQHVFCKTPIIGEDVCAIIDVLQHAKKVHVLQEGFYYYYWNLGSISHSGYTKKHEAALYHYIDVKRDLLQKGYLDRKYIEGYLAEYQMAVVTAMCRNQKYDHKVIKVLRADMEKSMLSIVKNESTSMFMKASIVVFVIMPSLFLKVFRSVHVITGR